MEQHSYGEGQPCSQCQELHQVLFGGEKICLGCLEKAAEAAKEAEAEAEKKAEAKAKPAAKAKAKR